MIRIATQYATLNITNQVVNTIPNLPPAVKVLAGITTAFGGYEILKSATKTLPPQMRTIASALIGVQAALLAVQQIPNLIAAFSSGTQVVTQ